MVWISLYGFGVTVDLGVAVFVVAVLVDRVLDEVVVEGQRAALGFGGGEGDERGEGDDRLQDLH